MYLNQLFYERPVLFQALGHYLHDTTPAIREEQGDLYDKLMILREKGPLPAIEITDEMKYVIWYSIRRTLDWIGTNTTHIWYLPLLRLKDLIEDKLDIIQEPAPPIESHMTFLKDGTYVITNGCRELINGQYCCGDLVCLNWKESEPAPHFIAYECNKCNKLLTRM